MTTETKTVSIEEVKAIVSMVFRNGYLEDLHAELKGFDDLKMKYLMKDAVDRLYCLSCIKQDNPALYTQFIEAGARTTKTWDMPFLLSPLEIMPIELGYTLFKEGR